VGVWLGVYYSRLLVTSSAAYRVYSHHVTFGGSGALEHYWHCRRSANSSCQYSWLHAFWGRWLLAPDPHVRNTS